MNLVIIRLTFKYKNGAPVKQIYTALAMRIGLDIYFIIDLFVEDMDIGFVFVITIVYASVILYRIYKKE